MKVGFRLSFIMLTTKDGAKYHSTVINRFVYLSGGKITTFNGTSDHETLTSIFAVLASLFRFCSAKNSDNPLKGDSSLNEHLFNYLKKNIRLAQYDSLCIESCAFVKFTVQKNTITDIQCSKSPPPFLRDILSKDIMNKEAHSSKV
jgi:hypothetical protein